MPIRTHNKFFALAALLVLLSGFSSISFAGFSPSSTGTACYPTLDAACGAQSPPSANFTSVVAYGGSYCRWSGTYNGSQISTDRDAFGCDSSCPPGQSRNASGQCENPPVECTAPKTNVNGVCQCPPLGSGSQAVSVTTGPDDPWPGQVNHGGCKYELPTSGNPNVDGNGNNCTVAQGGALTCWYNAKPTGEEAEPCETNPAACLPVPDSAPVDPTQTKPPETSTETQTTPTGTTTTTKEKIEKISPDGMVQEEDITTVTKTENGTTTVEKTTVTTVRNPDGSTTGTTQTTVTDGNGNTTITASGNTSKPAPGGANSGQEKQKEAEKGKGECDPTAANYNQCVGLLQAAPDADGQSLIASASGDANGFMDSAQGEILQSISARAEPPQADTFINWVKSKIPQPTSCTDVGFSFKGHEFSVPCSKLAIVREWFGWALGLATIFFCFQIALTPRAA